MSQFKPRSLCILGRQPALGLAELESLHGSEHIRPLGNNALLDIPAENINFKRLGGTIKTARVLATLPYTDWQLLIDYLRNDIPKHLNYLPQGKLTLGLSAYGLRVGLPQLNRSMLELKKIIKNNGRPVRVVPNKSLELNSAQVLHNKLTHRGGWELLLLADGQNTILAQTLFVQDIEAYAARDQARPARDPRVGMLPPKLAQIIINLAVGRLDNDLEDKARLRLLDPFCGSGVILQEALLMGYSVLGDDLDERMVDFSRRNLQWLVQNHPDLSGNVSLEVADATNYKWPSFSTLATETYLGRPLNRLPGHEDLEQIITDVSTITAKFLKNLHPQLKPRRTICLALPAWRKPTGELIHLPVIAKLTDMGYNRFSFIHVRDEDLIYYREGQVVCRELVVLTRS